MVPSVLEGAISIIKRRVDLYTINHCKANKEDMMRRYHIKKAESDDGI